MNSLPASLRRFLSLLLTATALGFASPAAAGIIINELDADQPSTDNAEFIELYDEGAGNTSLTGYFLVLFNGSSDRAYAVFDLAGKTTSATGYFVAGNAGVPNVGLVIPPGSGGFLQNGSNAGAEGDAVALCTGTMADIVTTPAGSATPVGSIPGTVTVVDAVVYDGGSVLSGNDTGLLTGLGMTGQNMVYDADAAGASAGRTNNAGGLKDMTAWASLGTNSPGGSNASVETLSLSFAPNSFDESDGAGASTATVTRTGPTSAAITVTLVSSDPSEASVQASVVIPIGSASAPFPVDAVNDGWNDGSQTVTITASAPLFTSGSANITVNDEGDPAALLLVNEVHATGRGDANADGNNASFGQDEFVEIVNVSAAPVDLGGWTLRETAGLAVPLQVRHTFPANSWINPGCALVVFGGGAPVEGRTAAFGHAWIIKANGDTVNGLSLNDTGDLVSLQDGSGVEMAGVTYAAIAAADNTKSLNRNPDLTGPNALVVHTNVPGAGAANYSPGTLVDGTKFCTLTEAFTVSLSPGTVTENSGTHANAITVSRPAPGTAAVQVTLTSSDTTEAVPVTTSFQLAAGVLTQQVSLSVPDDGVADGTQTATFTAAGEGYLNGTAILTVNDDGNDTSLSAVFINELDPDQTGTDNMEFIELSDGGIGNKLMDGFVVVLYNGANDQSYLTLDLTGLSTNAQGFFVIGNAGVPGVGLVIPDNTLQNGADAVAVHSGLASSFPAGTTVTTAGLIDAVVYGINAADDTGLLGVLTPGKPQANEGSNSATLALARRPDATTAFQPAAFVTQAPTPGSTNVTVTAYLTWAAAYPGLGTPDDDLDHDGLPNRLEFALGTHPLQSNPSGIPTPSFVAGNLRYTLNKGTIAGNDPATQFIPESATDLSNWSGANITIVTNNATTLVFDYTGTGPRAQLRTRIVTP